MSLSKQRFYVKAKCYRNGCYYDVDFTVEADYSKDAFIQARKYLSAQFHRHKLISCTAEDDIEMLNRWFGK